MMVIIGFTPSELGSRLPSATYSDSAPWTAPSGPATPRLGSASIRAVPIGWKASSRSSFAAGGEASKSAMRSRRSMSWPETCG